MALPGMFSIANTFWYVARRNSWMLDPRFWLLDYSSQAENRPLFLLGNQGGGLTLISRILRRHPHAVSPSGNSRYWAGADELQNVFGPFLPPELTGLRHKAPPHANYPPPRSWSYASDDVLPLYRRTETDASPRTRRALLHVLGYLTTRFATTSNPSVVDKSQVYTVRLALLHALLSDLEPRFILVTRNPYVECPRAASGKAADMRAYSRFMPYTRRLELCAQHWQNSLRLAFEDSTRLRIPLLWLRFEDFVHDPVAATRKICEFSGFDFDPGLLPNPNDRIPFGSRYRGRWYPIRPDVNRRYLENLTADDVEIVKARCHDLAVQLGYDSPAASA